MEKIFSVILYSKIQDQENFDIYADNLKSFFKNLGNPELIKYVYFVDDSDKKFQDSLKKTIEGLIKNNNFNSELIDVIDNGSIYNAFNRVWKLVKTEYVVSFNSDHRLIYLLPLLTVKKGLDRYPEIYSVILGGKISFGYSDSLAKKELKKIKPYYQVFGDNEMTTWFCFDEKEKKVYSIPCEFHSLQKKGTLPIEAWGNELMPLIIDEENNFWTTIKPARFLKGYYTNHEAFTGNPAILRTETIKKYLPLPKRYKKEGPAECQEMYFRRTDIDCENYLAYLNLQSFTVSYKDATKPLANMEKEYWQSFIKRNSQPFTREDFGISLEEAKENYQKILKAKKLSLGAFFCRMKSFLMPRLEELAILFFGKSLARKIAKKFWFLLKGQF